jgi:hypothetical protein
VVPSLHRNARSLGPPAPAIAMVNGFSQCLQPYHHRHNAQLSHMGLLVKTASLP